MSCIVPACFSLELEKYGTQSKLVNVPLSPLYPNGNSMRDTEKVIQKQIESSYYLQYISFVLIP